MLKSASAPFLAMLVVAGLGAAHPAAADEQRPREAVIAVSGSADAKAAPDQAMLVFSVMRIEETARAALDANNKAMAAVIADLKAQGIAENDIQTRDFSIDPQYVYPRDDNGEGKPPKLTGYRVVNALSVRVRDLAKVGPVLDRAVSLGVNEGGNIQFINADPSKAIASARADAMKDAMAKARVLAEAAGVKLGRIVEISERADRPEPMPMMRMSMAKQEADAVPIASGENTFTVTVNATFAIDQ